jgi:hypothetical protein
MGWQMVFNLNKMDLNLDLGSNFGWKIKIGSG